MKGLICWLLVLCMLAGCGAGDSDGAQSQEAAEAAASAGAASAPEYTQEELFLQEAYWYLQSDEKALFSWENGMVEDYCGEDSQVIIGPEGEREIAGMPLQRVQYTFFQIGEIENNVNLYFDENGQFVGTDGDSYFHGDIQMWVFADKQGFSADDTLTVTTVLKNWGESKKFITFGAVAWSEFFKKGVFVGGGVDASARELELKMNEVVVLENQYRDWDKWVQPPAGNGLPGIYTMVTFVEMQEILEDTAGEERGSRIQLREVREVEIEE